MSEAIGFLAKLGISASSPVDAQFEFLPGTNIGKTGIVLPNQGFRGVLDEHGSRTRDGEYTVSGRLEMEPGAAELALLLPWILGAAPSGTTYALSDNPPARYITMDKVTKVFTYAGCKVSEAIFSAQQGNDTALKLSIGVEGLTETEGNAGTFPSLSLSTHPYFTFNQDASVSVNSQAVQAARVEIAVRYTLHMRNLNSSSRTLVRPVRRHISLSLWLPYDDAAAYENLYDIGASGVPAVITFANAGHGTSLVFTFANVQFPTQPQEIDMNGEIMLRLDGIARRTGTDNNALICTLDSTPGS